MGIRRCIEVDRGCTMAMNARVHRCLLICVMSMLNVRIQNNCEILIVSPRRNSLL